MLIEQLCIQRVGKNKVELSVSGLFTCCVPIHTCELSMQPINPPGAPLVLQLYLHVGKTLTIGPLLGVQVVCLQQLGVKGRAVQVLAQPAADANKPKNRRLH